MSTATEEISTYLLTMESDDADRLKLALLFARSMTQELRAALQDWEHAVKALEKLKPPRAWPACN